MSTEKELIYYELLVLRCQRKEKGAIEELIHTWEKRLFYYIRRLVDNEQDAWDILQETWLKAIQGIRALREPRSLPAWLYHIARNASMSHFRNKGPNLTSLENNENPASIQMDEQCFNFANADLVHYGLAQISLPHREILTLYFLQDLTIEEIAEVLEIAPGTVKSRLYYARQSLRVALEKEV